eukprot:6213411-Pleurochrysis_carterae.AAC.2
MLTLARDQAAHKSRPFTRARQPAASSRLAASAKEVACEGRLQGLHRRSGCRGAESPESQRVVDALIVVVPHARATMVRSDRCVSPARRGDCAGAQRGRLACDRSVGGRVRSKVICRSVNRENSKHITDVNARESGR